MMFMPTNLVVENARRLTRSALPDAPVVPDDDRPSITRRAARRSLAAVRGLFAGSRRANLGGRRTTATTC
jgi:hypothetical protein